ncbi:alpha/beta hydrolase [Rhodococcus sp. B10]|uniref:alpha/beta fold hydrolase n=1 Tax=Rhodococcus sp. B10 TaxID=2695876 RepID=UPI001430C90D|nr:alpha/beta hydrolase [Rhodococcus sp. B10]NIL78333.1 putative aminoacrylate hydrolase RutD [Rhodococcus sp. B10]
MDDSAWLLLHGTPLTPAVWSEVRATLSERGLVLAPDIIPPSVADPSGLPARLAGEVAAQLPPDRSWHVVGHSFGGQVALELALLRPDLVARMTLLCTQDTPFPAFASAADAVAAGAVDVDGALQRWFGPEDLARDDSVVSYARRTLDTADPASWASALRAIAVFDCSMRTQSITCPVQVVAAEHDAVSDTVSMKAMHERLQRSTFSVLRDSWHMSVFSDPSRLSELLHDSTS